MNKDRYESICQQTEAGRDTFITHPSTGEKAMVTQCVPKTEHLVAQTLDGEKRCWDFHECEELHGSGK